MRKKQTAVEWLMDCYTIQGKILHTQEIQALEMERKQIEDAWKDDCGIIESVADKYASEYYQQTYGKEERK